MNGFKWASLVLSLSLGSSVFAASMSSTIPLEGGIAGPGGEIKILFDKLYPHVIYNISCDISNLNTQAEEKSAISVRVPDFAWQGSIILDDSIVYRDTTFFKSAGSKLVFRHTEMKHGAAIIGNLDYTDSIAVTNCKANIS